MGLNHLEELPYIWEDSVIRNNKLFFSGNRFWMKRKKIDVVGVTLKIEVSEQESLITVCQQPTATLHQFWKLQRKVKSGKKNCWVSISLHTEGHHNPSMTEEMSYISGFILACIKDSYLTGLCSVELLSSFCSGKLWILSNMTSWQTSCVCALSNICTLFIYP